jgi:hypothetical protein
MNINNFNKTYSNTFQPHPLQNNSQEYYLYKKYVSIHSEDRDILAYPNSSEFEIELPEDIINISTMKLTDWSFPSNYNTFSVLNKNITMYFKINNPYNPSLNGDVNSLRISIYNALVNYLSIPLIPGNYKTNGIFQINIEEGFYNPTEFVTELTNKFNEAVTKVITNFLVTNSLIMELEQFKNLNGYNRFVIVYNNVSQKVWFGNRCDGFELLNEIVFENSLGNDNDIYFCKRNQLPDLASWGLPSNIGLSRENVVSNEPIDLSYNYIRFYYGNVIDNDNGYWLLPETDPITGNNLPGAIVQFIECPYKINIFGPSYIYMEVFKYNMIDETEPYNINSFTLTTNETNGIVNSAFAKIPIVSTPLTQYYDGPSDTYKFFNPPIERIRRLKFKFRYHNGCLVDFSTFPFTFTIEFTILLPMINRAVKLVNNVFNNI